jgi:hypothetical protein
VKAAKEVDDLKQNARVDFQILVSFAGSLLFVIFFPFLGLLQDLWLVLWGVLCFVLLVFYFYILALSCCSSSSSCC